jgi:hypothetical protein
MGIAHSIEWEWDAAAPGVGDASTPCRQLRIGLGVGIAGEDSQPRKGKERIRRKKEEGRSKGSEYHGRRVGRVRPERSDAETQRRRDAVREERSRE